MKKALLLKVIQYILSKPWIDIICCYPMAGEINGAPLSPKQVLLAVTDIDAFLAGVKNISKEEFIKRDEKDHGEQTKFSRKYEMGEDVGEQINERHYGIRFYPWFPPTAPFEENPFLNPFLNPIEFFEWSKEEQRSYLELRSESHTWDELRGMILGYYGPECFRCGDPETPSVDHILPKSKYPQLEKDFMNLQILCKSCNSIKGNRHISTLRENKRNLTPGGAKHGGVEGSVDPGGLRDSPIQDKADS